MSRQGKSLRFWWWTSNREWCGTIRNSVDRNHPSHAFRCRPQYKSQGSVSKIITFRVWCEIDDEKAENCWTHDFFLHHPWFPRRTQYLHLLRMQDRHRHQYRYKLSHAWKRATWWQWRTHWFKEAEFERIGNICQVVHGWVRIWTRRVETYGSSACKIDLNDSELRVIRMIIWWIRIAGWISQVISGGHWLRWIGTMTCSWSFVEAHTESERYSYYEELKSA